MHAKSYLWYIHNFMLYQIRADSYQIRTTFDSLTYGFALQ